MATLWTTGPDTTSDVAVKAAAMRRTPAGDWELFEELCAPPGEGSDADLETAALERFGISEDAWRAGRPLEEVGADLRAFLGDGPVLVTDGPTFEGWLEHMVGESGAAPPTLDLAEMARLVAPGPLAARGEALVRHLVPEHDDAAGDPAPPEVWFAFEALARRLRTLPADALRAIALGYSIAAEGLAAHDGAAALRIALALALVRYPERWAPSSDDAPAPHWPSPREVEILADALDELRPQWTRRARVWQAAPSLPPRLDDPTPFPDEDHRLLDRIFESVLPSLFSARDRGSASGYRESQHRVATEIARTLGRDELLAVHAPTGTGKTLAYLLPALVWARRHGVRVGVATYTRSLQSQAMEHEVPRALRALAEAGVDGGFRVSVLKGRANYLCWRALCSWTPEAADAPEVWLAWTSLVVFSQTDPDGDLDRFPRRAPVRLRSSRPYEAQIGDALRRVFARSGCCTHQDDRQTCGAEVARRLAERSHLVLTNHSFALARQEFFRHILFDECEHLHEVAHNAWSHELSFRAAREVLGRIGPIETGRAGAAGRDGRRGGRRRRRSGSLLVRLGKEALFGSPLQDAVEAARENLDDAAIALADLEDGVDGLESWRAERRRGREGRDEHTLLREYMDRPDAEPLIEARQRLGAAGSALDARLSEIAERLDAQGVRRLRGVRRGVDLARSELIELMNELEAWLPLDAGRPAFRTETFYDVETDPRGNRSLVARVLLPAEYLGRNYYPALANGVFLSATTWLQSSFDAALAYLGLDRAAEPDLDEERVGRDVRTFRAPEVFDYSRVQVLVPRDAPSVAREKEAFLDYVRNFVAWIGERTRGRMLVLFTNAQDARTTGLALEGFFRARRIPLLYQGMEGAEKEELAERFRSRVDSILLGLDTFWYGADFPGETLEYLVLVKLPYGVPDRYHHAQCAVLGQSEQRRRIYQPRALAKFRQGFGRLLRTTDDRGCVFVLDERILDPRPPHVPARAPAERSACVRRGRWHSEGAPRARGHRHVRPKRVRAHGPHGRPRAPWPDEQLPRELRRRSTSTGRARRPLPVPSGRARRPRGDLRMAGAPAARPRHPDRRAAILSAATDSSGREAWVEVRVVVPVGFHELVADALAIEPCTSVAIGRTSIGMEPPPEGFDFVRTFYAAHFDSAELRSTLRERLEGLARDCGLPELQDLAVRYRELPPEDFATSWKKTWRSFRVGRICVVPPDSTYVPRPGEVRLLLEPGGVFGTGRHATTRTVLRHLQGFVAAGERVLDAGAGSGILGTAAALLGAGEVFGFDIDPNSPVAASRLAERSGVSDRTTFVAGGFERVDQGRPPFDGLLANIYADVLQAEARTMADALRPGGWFLLSGCLDEHAPATRPVLEAAGLWIEREHSRGRWFTFAGRRAD